VTKNNPIHYNNTFKLITCRFFMRNEILVVFLLLISVGFISFISAVPPEPMAFYGNVSMNGTLIPNGYYLTAKINEIVSGQCEVINGIYGMGENTCIVQSYSSNKVKFYLGNNFLGEYPFQGKEIVNLNFQTDSLPSNFTPLSNGVCEPSKGECSYNLLDCGNSITTVCVGNGICDSNIGETCSNAPNDCGACQTTTPPGGGGGGGGGGSGGGGSSSGVTTPVDVQFLGDNSQNPGSSEGENNNQLSNETSQKEKIFGITGLAIGEFAGTTLGIITIIILVLVLLGILYYFFFGKK